MFELDPRLARSSAPLLALDLCDARLQLDSRFPWIVLAPRREAVRELDDLSENDLQRLTQEILIAGRALRQVCKAFGAPIDKLNVGALGNIVPQLHVHVVGRRVADAAWPGPVWGHGAATAYERADLAQLTKGICEQLDKNRDAC